ncbi:hypothetical protein PspLS_02073 [Pyricularia sp. CBS 133598]|nr:hypothetical protein PspLS_02073 [Pyricularia sp. CBS 133598]
MFSGFLVKTWVFIATISLSQAAQVIVGYRTCNEIEARPYMNAPARLTRNPVFDRSVAWQIGNGVYTSPRRGEYMPVGGAEWQVFHTPLPLFYLRFLVITAEQDDFNQLPKMWIPQRFDFKPEATIAKYVDEDGCGSESTLRFAPMRPSSANLQMLIPTTMINENPPTVQFWARAYRLSDPNAPNQVLNYNAWGSFVNNANVQKRSILARRATCPAKFRGKKAAGGSARPPSSAGSRPPSSAGSRPPSSAGSRPPSSAGSRPPSSAGSRPPSSAGSRPPSSAGSRPPSSAGSRPPSSAGSRPPSSAGSRPPASAGSKPPGSSRGTTRP